MVVSVEYHIWSIEAIEPGGGCRRVVGCCAVRHAKYVLPQTMKLRPYGRIEIIVVVVVAVVVLLLLLLIIIIIIIIII